MRLTTQVAAFAATAAANQFVLYADGSRDLAERSDPIITPGDLSGHVHQIFGSSAFKPELSTGALQQNTDCTTVGGGDFSGNAEDNSNYWHPAMYAQKKNGEGYLKIPTGTHKMYYRKKDLGTTGKYLEPFGFPKDFRMVAGDPFLRSSDGSAGVKWICYQGDDASTWIEGENGAFPSSFEKCSAMSGMGLNGQIHFPHCWNGQPFNVEDPNAHMAYPDGGPEDGDCPESHPTIVPHILLENAFDIASVWDEIDPTTITLANGDNTGYGWHADMFNGWVDGAIDELMNTCPQGEYGNHDIGLCPSYKKYDKSQAECALTGTYKESVDSPGSNLPGCNPIQTAVNGLAKMFAIAPLGTSTDQCGEGSGSSTPDDSYDSPPSDYSPSESASASASSSSISYAAPSDTLVEPTSTVEATTMMTEVAPSSTIDYSTWYTPPGAADAYVAPESVEEEDDDDDVVWVTEWAEPAVETQYVRRNVHQHLEAHKRRDF